MTPGSFALQGSLLPSRGRFRALLPSWGSQSGELPPIMSYCSVHPGVEHRPPRSPWRQSGNRAVVPVHLIFMTCWPKA